MHTPAAGKRKVFDKESAVTFRLSVVVNIYKASPSSNVKSHLPVISITYFNINTMLAGPYAGLLSIYKVSVVYCLNSSSGQHPEIVLYNQSKGGCICTFALKLPEFSYIYVHAHVG